MQTFLQDGRVEIDSNAVENLIRPIALTRKNALFVGHNEGGRIWGRIASLIATAKINGVEPFAYQSRHGSTSAAGSAGLRIRADASAEPGQWPTDKKFLSAVEYEHANIVGKKI